MRTPIYIAAATALATTAAIANIGSEDISEETRTVGNFDEITLKGSMDVSVTVGKEKSVRVVADSNIIEYLETKVSGSNLIIDLEDGRSYRNIEKMHVYVTVPSLKAANLYGSGDIDIENIDSDRFSFDLRGSGDAILTDISTKSLNLDLAGSGDIQGNGSCKDLDVNLRGSGDITVKSIKCDNAEVNLQGSGDVNIFAKENAEVNVRGSGDVDVYGDPDTFDSNVRGSGDVSRK
jgi:hypothetical protein